MLNLSYTREENYLNYLILPITYSVLKRYSPFNSTSLWTFSADTIQCSISCTTSFQTLFIVPSLLVWSFSKPNLRTFLKLCPSEHVVFWFRCYRLLVTSLRHIIRKIPSIMWHKVKDQGFLESLESKFDSLMSEQITPRADLCSLGQMYQTLRSVGVFVLKNVNHKTIAHQHETSQLFGSRTPLNYHKFDCHWFNQ